jgi:ElaB/YqjD/DUF883 family membrane-anchored ribosome-binding protein
MRHAAVPRAETAEGGLGRLIETEARIAEALAAVQAEAATLLEAASRQADDEEHRLGERLEAEIASIAARIAAERDDEIRRVTAAAEARSQRLREMPASVVDELAAWLMARVMTQADRGRPS